MALKNSRVELVPLTLGHLDRLCLIGLDPRLWQATTIKVQDRGQMESYVLTALKMQTEGTALPFVIVEQKTREIVGTTRYYSAIPEHKRVEIGFTWISPPWQRAGLNAAAKYLMLRYAFDELGCIRVEFKANAGNEQSRRALLGIGAKQEGVLRNYRVSSAGEIFDLAIFSVIAAEWPEVRLGLEEKLKRVE